MTNDLDNYRYISTRILDLQKQLSTLTKDLVHSYDNENFTVAATAQNKDGNQTPSITTRKNIKNVRV